MGKFSERMALREFLSSALILLFCAGGQGYRLNIPFCFVELRDI